MDNRSSAAPDMDATMQIIYIVDDDVSMREALLDLFLSLQMKAEAFESAASFLKGANLGRPGCILLDVRLPGINGLDFQIQLADMGSLIPVIFMSGHGDIPMSVRAMKAGAIDFLTKPFRDQDVLDAVASAIKINAASRSASELTKSAISLVATLTPREREVMDAVVSGKMNKQIAFDLGISEITVKLHRGNVMRKTQARSVADLVRLSEAASSR